MWRKYRKLKDWATPPVLALGLFLMSGEPDESVRSTVGIILAAGCGLLYLGEELAWIKIDKDRPCKNCGQRVPIRTFRLAHKCPHCGKIFD